jgi:hypothetical protein
VSTSTKGRACVGKVRHASKAEAQAHPMTPANVPAPDRTHRCDRQETR